MMSRTLLIVLCLYPLISGCGQTRSGADEITGARAEELVRRNLLDGQDRYPVEAPRAYQYGSIHIDGPDGGMLYRFGSGDETLAWMVAHHHMAEVSIGSSDPIPLDFPDDSPAWWDPWQSNPQAYFISIEQLERGGSKTILMVNDDRIGTIYVAVHFSGLPGI